MSIFWQLECQWQRIKSFFRTGKWDRHEQQTIQNKQDWTEILVTELDEGIAKLRERIPTFVDIVYPSYVISRAQYHPDILKESPEDIKSRMRDELQRDLEWLRKDMEDGKLSLEYGCAYNDSFGIRISCSMLDLWFHVTSGVLWNKEGLWIWKDGEEIPARSA